MARAASFGLHPAKGGTQVLEAIVARLLTLVPFLLREAIDHCNRLLGESGAKHELEGRERPGFDKSLQPRGLRCRGIASQPGVGARLFHLGDWAGPWNESTESGLGNNCHFYEVLVD